MSSLEEERLVQMVHDFIESETPTPTNPPTQTLPLHQSTLLKLQVIVGSATKAELEVFEDVLKRLRKMGTERKSCGVKNRLMMGLRMDGYDASLCKSSWVANLHRFGGDYEYIDIMMMDVNGGPLRLIVDIDFKSQFELARPTLSYTQLFNTLPSIFVGDEEKLSNIVSLLSSAAEQSLRESGLHIPPWRKASYMQSKWLSCYQKISTNIPFPISNQEVGRDGEARRAELPSKASNWTPPKVEPRRRHLSGSQGSCLSSQFSSPSINCC
ncbi:uncharacterized protein LOC131242582 [Magnolia sinica]|uniref:uncharacterized protein LOC131242582 n=1 Tax=Magnolia sinica TaxID=86752 RepID=UPI00265904C2|nr:uncharacterized protein LOC131242582 [Magnolia sinica]